MFPNYAAFTFPFVISAIASKQTMACAANMGHPMPFLQYVVLVDLDNYCSSTCCLYLCSLYGGYFRRKEIKDLTGQIKKGKLKFIKNMSDEGRPRHRKGPKKQSVR